MEKDVQKNLFFNPIDEAKVSFDDNRAGINFRTIKEKNKENDKDT